MHSTPSLLEYAQERTTLKKIGGEFKGPCPVPGCGGTDRFCVFKDGTGWMCRKCRPTSGGVYDLISACEGITLQEAMRSDRKREPAPMRLAPENHDRQRQTGDWRADSWQLKVRGMIQRGLAAFPGSDGETYLLSRGLTKETCEAFRFGFDPLWPTKYGRENDRPIVIETSPAVLMPWIILDSKVCALKIRLMGERDKNDRFRQVKGGNQRIFGGHLAKRAHTAIFVEGELNAASVWQVMGDQYDVMSFGGETNYRTFMDIEPLYSRCLVWLDDDSKDDDSKGVKSKVELFHSHVQSPTVSYMVSPDGLDANDILKNYGGDLLRELVRGRL